MNNLLGCEDNNNSRRRQGKRMLAEVNSCKFDLKVELPLLFQAFQESIEKTNKMLFMFPPEYRSRNLEASIVQSSFAEEILTKFQSNAFFGKYKRLILSINNYLILFKKLDKSGMPMNIKTGYVQSILNQSQLDLFSDSDYNDVPILYFGYQKNRFGEYVNPQLIYIDEGKVVFSINESEIGISNIQHDDVDINIKNNNEVLPKLKDNNDNQEKISI